MSAGQMPSTLAPSILRQALAARDGSADVAHSAAWSMRRWLILVLLYSIPVIMALKPIVDPDVWWHLKVGEWIVEHRAVPWTDSFSEYGAGQWWIAYNWLFEVVLYGLHAALGLYGPLLYTLIMGLSLAVLLHAFLSREARSFTTMVLLLAVGLGALGPVVLPRSFMVSIVGFAAVMHVVMVCRESGKTRPLMWLPLLFLVWANMHIQYVYGLFALGLAALESFVYRLGGATFITPSTRVLPFRAAALTLLACAAATTVTPYHLYLHLSVLEVIGQTGPFQYLREMQSLAFRSAWDWLVLGLVLAAAFSLGWRRRLDAFPAMVLLFGVFVSFRAIRDVWVVVVAAVAILSIPAGHAAAAVLAWPRLAWRRLALVALGIVATVVLVFAARGLTPAGLDAAVEQQYPVKAADFIERQGYRGPLFNEYGWGGYLIWRLPLLPVSMDGRANLHGDERIKRAIETWGGMPSWRSDPELAVANVVIGPRNAALASLLRLDDRFDLAYEDDVAVVFVRRGAPGIPR